MTVKDDMHPMGLTCIVCLRNIESSIADDANSLHQPSVGTSFTTRGHYGSTVFDPMDGREVLDITVCDLCMLERSSRGVITHVKDGNAQRWDAGEMARKNVPNQIDYMNLVKEFPLYYYKNGVKIQYLSHASAKTARIRIGESKSDKIVGVGDQVFIKGGHVLEVTYVTDLSGGNLNTDMYGATMVAFRTVDLSNR
jgi:hypothetical protein